jgi:hypothetical protein
MRDQKERWLQLCEKAAVEQDPEKLLKLVNEIARILGEKQQRVVKQYSQQESAKPSGSDAVPIAG